MNLLDPVKWGAQAAFTVTTTGLKIANSAVHTIELLLGRNDDDDAEQRYSAVATKPAEAEAVVRDRETPGSAVRERRPPEPTRTSVPKGERSTNAVSPPTPESHVEHTVEEPDELVETEGAASPSASLRVDAPWDGYEKLNATEIAARVRESDPATKAVVRLYEQTHKKRKSVLAATE